MKKKSIKSNTMKNKIKEFIEKSVLIRPNEKIIVAVSGGSDSIALLHLLKSLEKEMTFSCIAVHLNHKLRGDESFRDEIFVKDFCKVLQVPLSVKREDIRAFAKKNRQNLEKAGRDRRYAFFKKMAKKYSCSAIFTAHTRDDQVETLLMRLFRGTGLQGAGGIRDNSLQDGFQIVRPLLSINKKSILSYLKEKKLTFITDSSNKDISFTRNKMRLKVIPYIKRELGDFQKQLIDFSEICRDVDTFFDKYGKKFFKDYFNVSGSRLSILPEIMTSFPFYVSTYAIKNEIERCFPGIRSLSKKRLSDSLELLSGLQTGRTVDISNNLIFLKERESIFVLNKKELSESKKIRLKLKGSVGCEVSFFNWELVFSVRTFKTISFRKIKHGAVLKKIKEGKQVDFRIKLPWQKSKIIYIRSFKAGDRIDIVLNGKKHTKKLKELFCDHKIPLFMKKRIPVIMSEKTIVYIPGLYINPFFEGTKGSKEVLEMRIKFKEPPAIF